MYRLEMCRVPLSEGMVAPGSEYGGDINALKYRCIDVPLSEGMVAPGSEYSGEINALKYRLYRCTSI